MDGFNPYTIELANAYQKGDDVLKYNDNVKANQNFLNQNFNGIFDEFAALKAKIAELEGRIP